jgi:endonuclease YncB( thermonuclease family)
MLFKALGSDRPPSRANSFAPPRERRNVVPIEAHAPARPPRPITAAPPPVARPKSLKGKCRVIDGDTIEIGRTRIRIAGIDAPELDHPYGQKARWAMVRLCKGQVITADITGELSYDRYVATCFLPDGRDLGAELVREGLAIDWPRYSGGRYRGLEPPGIRRKLWRADARQKGRMPPGDFGR